MPAERTAAVCSARSDPKSGGRRALIFLQELPIYRVSRNNTEKFHLKPVYGKED